MSNVLDNHKEVVRRCVRDLSGIWPEGITSSIFYEGQKVTIEEFVKFKKLYKLARSQKTSKS